DPLRFFLNLSRQYGEISSYRFLNATSTFANKPAYVKWILQVNNRNYDKQIFSYQLLGRALGQGLLTNDGESWLHQRRLLQPAFHRPRPGGVRAPMVDAAAEGDVC